MIYQLIVEEAYPNTNLERFKGQEVIIKENDINSGYPTMEEEIVRVLRVQKCIEVTGPGTD